MRARFFAPVQTGPEVQPPSCTMGTWPLQGVKSGWCVTLTPHPLLVPWSRKSRAIPLLPPWVVRPVQSLSVCTRVHFTFPLPLLAYWIAQLINNQVLNRLTPNDPYMGRTAQLTSKRCMLYIYSTNIGTEYFKHALYSPFFSLQNAVCFIMLTSLVSVLFTFYIQGALKIKKK